ncbi:MAG: hemin ABC transporter substrate-binding protein [Acidimicrobiales bacterium]
MASPHRRWRAIAIAAALLAGCGGADATADTASSDGIATETPIATTEGAAEATATETPTATAEPAENGPQLPVTLVDDTGTEVRVESIERILPVDGDLAEVVFALGLGDRVVATDLSATYPPEAAALPQIGYQRALSAEPIASVEPTVVLATDLAGPPETIDALRTLGIPVVVIERDPSMEGPGDKIRAVAEALGIAPTGAELAATVDAEIAAASSGVSTADPVRVAVLYLRGENVQIIFGAETSVDALLGTVGAVNVGAELGIVDTGQITAESLLAAAPDVIIVTTTGLESVGGIDGLLAIPGVAETPAGRERRVLVYEDQFLLGSGPRTGELVSELARDLSTPPPKEDS